MSYTIEYNTLDAKAQQEARKDCIAWLGSEDKYHKIIDDLAAYHKTHTNMRRCDFHFTISFAGIQGYPVDVMIGDVLTLSRTPKCDEFELDRSDE